MRDVLKSEVRSMRNALKSPGKDPVLHTEIREEVVHFPELTFIRYCDERFRVNRGVYNTIERWFFEFGLKDIVVRRSDILSFLEYARRSGTAGNGLSRLRFGPGGLVKLLSDFVRNSPMRLQSDA